VGHDAMMLIEDVRSQIADDINCKPDEIIFTGSACESNSLAITGVLNTDDYVDFFTTRLEHTSITEFIENTNRSVYYIANDKYGYINMENLEEALVWDYCRNIKIFVSIAYANSEIGVVQDIKSIAELVHKYDGILHVDATQAYPWMKIDVQSLGIDLMSVSGQKFHAGRGCAFLYVKDGIELKPIIYGSQENSLRGGTYNTAAICGMGKALELTREHNPADRVERLRECAIHHLGNIDMASINGPLSYDYRLPNIISLTIDGVNADTLVTMCDLMGVCIAKGSACKSYEPTPSQTLLAIGLTEDQALNTIRISLDEFNTVEEITRAADIITQLVEQIRKNT
jgi:cysteine desulfurase